MICTRCKVRPAVKPYKLHHLCAPCWEEWAKLCHKNWIKFMGGNYLGDKKKE